MKKLEIETFKELLKKKKEEMLECLKTLDVSAKPVDLGTPIGRLSRMDAIGQQQLQLSNKLKIEDTLKKIDTALIRIGDGTYGECLKCEDEISRKRLTANPWATMCIDCQEGIEK